MSTLPLHTPTTQAGDRRPISVVVADNCAFVRFAIINELRRHADIAVIGEAATGSDMLQIVRETQPDVLVLDIQMPDVSAADLAARLQALPRPPRMLVVTASADAHVILTMLSASATGYLLKDESPATIAAAVSMVAQGMCCISAAATEQIVRYASSWATVLSVSAQQPAAEPGRGKLPQPILEAGLNAREIDVLWLTVQGYTNQQIAETLAISKGTVQNRVSDLYHKLGVRSRTELVAWGWKRGLI